MSDKRKKRKSDSLEDLIGLFIDHKYKATVLINRAYASVVDGKMYNHTYEHLYESIKSLEEAITHMQEQNRKEKKGTIQ